MGKAGDAPGWKKGNSAFVVSSIASPQLENIFLNNTLPPTRFVDKNKLTGQSRGYAASCIFFSSPILLKCSMLLEWRVNALGLWEVVGFLSSTTVLTSRQERSAASVSPTGPPPTIKTSASAPDIAATIWVWRFLVCCRLRLSTPESGVLNFFFGQKGLSQTHTCTGNCQPPNCLGWVGLVTKVQSASSAQYCQACQER